MNLGAEARREAEHGITYSWSAGLAVRTDSLSGVRVLIVNWKNLPEWPRHRE